LAAADNYWYKGTINGRTVGLTRTKCGAGSEYVTAPPGAAITGAIVVIDGQVANLVLNSNGHCWRCTDGMSWRQCDDYRGQYESSFVPTDLYTKGQHSSAPPGYPDPSSA
jgi:hypothetical protein